MGSGRSNPPATASPNRYDDPQRLTQAISCRRHQKRSRSPVRTADTSIRTGIARRSTWRSMISAPTTWNRRRRRPVRCAGSHMTLERWLSVETAMETRSSRYDRRNILQRCPSRHGSDRRCSTNRHWPARCQPTGFSPVDAIRHWSAEATDHPREVMEAALAHKVRNQVEAAYRRTDLFECRRRLMDDWADYLAGETPEPEAAPSRRRTSADPRALADSAVRTTTGSDHNPALARVTSRRASCSPGPSASLAR